MGQLGHSNPAGGIRAVAARCAVWGFLAFISAGTLQAEVKIVGQVVHTGFPSGSMDCFRPGSWCPALVELQNLGDEHLSGKLVLHQRDKDGDVMITESVVSLVAGGPARPFRIDFIAEEAGGTGSFLLTLYDEDGRHVPVHDSKGNVHQALPAPPVHTLGSDVMMVLDLSSRPVTWLDVLEGNPKALRYPLVVTRLKPERLPDRWYCLRSVQAIVWDRPEPDRLSPDQVQALMDYVYAGGVLVLSAGRTAQALQASSLGEILPVLATGTIDADVLQAVWDDVLGWRTTGQPTPFYERPATVVRAQAKPRADVLCREDGLKSDVVVRGRWGTGVVTFLGVELHDLLRPADDQLRVALRLFPEVLGLGISAQTEKSQPPGMVVDLVDEVHRSIGFYGLGGAFLIFVMLFVGGYILLASFATWAWLRRQNELHHAWVVFAVVAAAFSVLSVGAVQVVRGVGTDVRQLSVVDARLPARLGEPIQAHAEVFYGVKTSTHTRMDMRIADADEVQLAGHRCTLKPLPTVRKEISQRYVAPESYTVRASQATLEGVPIRATLKRLQGHWFGRLEGSFSALLETDMWGRFSSRCYLRNDLGFPLRNCYLLLPKTPRLGGLLRSSRINVFKVSQEFLDGQRVNLLEAGLAIQTDEVVTWPTLDEEQTRWLGEFAPVRGTRRREGDPLFTFDRFGAAIALVTTLDEYDVYDAERWSKPNVRRTHLLPLDLSHLLTQGTALFVAEADVPGPVKLAVKSSGTATWQTVDEPDVAKTVFRFAIPVGRLTSSKEQAQ